MNLYLNKQSQECPDIESMSPLLISMPMDLRVDMLFWAFYFLTLMDRNWACNILVTNSTSVFSDPSFEGSACFSNISKTTGSFKYIYTVPVKCLDTLSHSDQ